MFPDLRQEKAEEMARDIQYEQDMRSDSDFFLEQVNMDIQFEDCLQEFISYCKRYDRNPRLELENIVDMLT
jgi:hypothetical protein